MNLRWRMGGTRFETGKMILVSMLTWWMGVGSSPQINVEMKVDWRSSYLSEASEFYWERNHGLFWMFLDRIGQKGEIETIQDFNREMVEQRRLTQWDVELMDMGISTRYYAPMVEMYQNMAESLLRHKGDEIDECDGSESVVIVNGRIFRLNKNPEDHEFGHGTNQREPVQTVLLGNLSDPRFSETWTNIQTKCGKKKYQFYHFSETRTSIGLTGYRIELVIKNTEYKTSDEEKIQTIGEKDVVRDEDWMQGLNKLRNTISGTQNTVPGNRTAFDAGIRAVEWIGAQPDKIVGLTSVTQNLPAYLPLLGMLNKTDDPDHDFERFNKEMMQLMEGTSLFTINGFVVDGASGSPFKLFEWLDSWYKHYRLLESHGFGRELIESILVPGLENDMRTIVDIRSNSTIYFPKESKDVEGNRTVDFIVFFNPGSLVQLEIGLRLINLFGLTKEFRVGVNFIRDSSELNEIVTKTAYQINDTMGSMSVFVFFQMIWEIMSPIRGKELTVDIVELILGQLEGSNGNRDRILWTKADKSQEIMDENMRINRVANTQLVSIFVNGEFLDISGSVESLFMKLNQVYFSQMDWFDDRKDMSGDSYESFLKHHNVHVRVNHLLSNVREYLPLKAIQEWSTFGLGLIRLTLSGTRPVNGLVRDSIWIGMDFGDDCIVFTKDLLLAFCEKNRDVDLYLIIRGKTHPDLSRVQTFDQGLELLSRIRTGDLVDDPMVARHEQFVALIECMDKDFVIVNGRLIRSRGLYTRITASEIERLAEFGDPNRDVARRVLETMGRDWEWMPHVMVFVKTVQMSLFIQDGFEGMVYTPSKSGSVLRRLKRIENLDRYTFEVGNGRNEESRLFQVHLFIDVMGRDAGRVSEWIRALGKYSMVHGKVTMYSSGKPSNTRFYRYNFHSGTIGGETNKGVWFEGLPDDLFVAMGVDHNYPWVERSVYSDYDLDNLKLSEMGNGLVRVRYRLEWLIVEGQCRSVGDSSIRGLELELKDWGVIFDDTSVMESGGYFQLKARPGVFDVKLKDGPSQVMYKMISLRTRLVLSTFEPRPVPIVVEKRMEHKSATLQEWIQADSRKSLVERVRGLFGSKEEKIHIFSVASGYLYERFLRVMIKSVLTTKEPCHKIKFWLLGNFLSPDFVDQLPYLAHVLDFEYELVMYKWPRWVSPQTDKQRTIWAYKILFLDVLFPGDLKRIIFLDADLIVRHSLQELIDLDMGPSPYGFTPMGDSNKATEGFRFWKKGYWKTHLKGKKYHISALFVVDLAKFRSLGVGDLLRQQYQALSKDQESLANLDQDLPNNIQEIVPIHSLDESWCWCETWCSAETQSRAKAIDQCNNPMTKESKLVRARKLVSEWDRYDQFMTRILYVFQQFKSMHLAEDGGIDMDGWKEFYARTVRQTGSQMDGSSHGEL